MSEIHLHGSFKINPFGPKWAMDRAFPHMKAKGWGRIVNQCSLIGVNAHAGAVDYNVGKEALRTLTRTVAREWAEFGMRKHHLPCSGFGVVPRARATATCGRIIGDRWQPHEPHGRSRTRYRRRGPVPRQRRCPLPRGKHAVRRWRGPYQRRRVSCQTYKSTSFGKCWRS